VEGRNYPKARSGFGLLSAFGFRASDQDFRQCFSDIPCAAIALRNDGKTDGSAIPKGIVSSSPATESARLPWVSVHVILNPFSCAIWRHYNLCYYPTNGTTTDSDIWHVL